MNNLLKKMGITLFFFSTAFAITGCDDNKLEDAADEVGDAIDDVVDDIKDATN